MLKWFPSVLTALILTAPVHAADWQLVQSGESTDLRLGIFSGPDGWWCFVFISKKGEPLWIELNDAFLHAIVYDWLLDSWSVVVPDEYGRVGLLLEPGNPQLVFTKGGAGTG